MKDIVILVVEDESEVRDAIVRDLECFESDFLIEVAEDVDDAREVMTACTQRDQALGLVLCDHILPGKNGVDFLIELNADPHFSPIRKVLVTGQAGLGDTIQAVNRANLDYYVAKPWDPQELQDTVRRELTTFVLERGKDLLAYVDTLDGPRLLEAISAGPLNE